MEAFLTTAGVAVATALLAFALSWWRGRSAASDRLVLQHGGRASVRARLALAGGRSRAGRIALTPTRSVWTPRRGGPSVDLTGSSPLAPEGTGSLHARPEDVVVGLRLPDGTSAELLIDAHAAALVAEVLEGLRAAEPCATPPRRPARRWWAYLLLAFSGLWLAMCLSMYVTGYDATATVVGGDGQGFCEVVWEDRSGMEQSGEADCDDDPVGSRLDVRVSGWPVPEDPSTPGLYAFVALVIAVPLGGVGCWRLLHVRNRSQVWPAPEDGPSFPLADPASAQALTRGRRGAWLLTGAGAVGVGLVLTVATVEISADDDLRAVGITTVGTILDVEPDESWSAGSASVRFTAGGVTEARDVTLGGYADDYVEGDVVDVVYDPAAPDRFIIDDALYGPGWTGWALFPSLLLALLAPVGVVRVIRIGRARSQFIRTGTAPPRRGSGTDWTTALVDW